MLNISGFLDKFKKFDKDKSQQSENIANIIGSVTGIKIRKDNFSVKDGILVIKGSPVLKQELFLKKENLLSLLKAEGVFDIR